MPESHCNHTDAVATVWKRLLKKVFHVCHMKYPDSLPHTKHTVGDRDSRGRGRGVDGNFRTPTCIACLVEREGEGNLGYVLTLPSFDRAIYA